MSVEASNATNYTTATSGITTASSGSLQLIYAQLQLEQAEFAKEDATAYLEKIEASQAEQALCSEMISQATALMETAETDDKCVVMPQEMIDFFEDRGITFDLDGDDYSHDSDQWEYNIENLSTYRDELGTTTQTDMVYVEDFMGQYNSYLTGANSTIDSSNQTLQTVLS